MNSQPPEHWFKRDDETDDARFYASPRFVTHIDDQTIGALTDFYRSFLASCPCVLDLMSSWISHYPEEMSFERATGLGMNEEELAHNRQLTDWVVQDLNQQPILNFDNETFDRATIAVSIQYLTKPLDVMAELFRVLRPGGRICIAMSHRLFPTKAVAAFVNLPPEERIRLVMFYLTDAGFTEVEFIDRSPQGYDPLWLVVGTVQQRAG